MALPVVFCQSCFCQSCAWGVMLSSAACAPLAAIPLLRPHPDQPALIFSADLGVPLLIPNLSPGAALPKPTHAQRLFR